MFEFALELFRGFHQTMFVPIRPITLLVGENSAGKSSFLAAIKYYLDLISSRREPSFNKDPFQLGTFDQIAHYRGGKAGRAKEFKLKLRKMVKPTHAQSEAEVPISIILSFVNSDAQAAISNIKIDIGTEAIIARVNRNNSPTFTYLSHGIEVASIYNRFFPMIRMERAQYLLRLLVDIGIDTRLNKSKLDTLVGADKQIIFFLSIIRRALEEVDVNVEASSPIRTKPQRTYTPGTEIRGELRDCEGSHVPYEMARLDRGSAHSWKKIKNDIEEYGRSSEMFREIGIKSFGKRDMSGPFQIQLSMEGPKTNIVDLGYGTSQVLPIIYSVATAQDPTVVLIQQPEVHLHPKAQAALGSYFVSSYTEKGIKFILETHSDYIVDRVRQAVADGVIRPNDVAILYFERKRLENAVTLIEVDDKGMPINPPNAYRSFFLDEQLRLLGI